jgi:HD-GYP domain-containing protein (c-di-GMP phosphodiesterase class II)
MNEAVSKHFILLLIDDKISKIQRKALLQSATNTQVLSLVDIANNLLYSELPLNKAQQTLIKKKKRILKILAHKTKNIKTKQRYIYVHTKAVSELLLGLATPLRKLLE